MVKNTIFVSTIMLIASSFACDGCSKPEEKPPIKKIEKKVELPPKVEEDPLKAAKQNADSLSTLQAIAISDLAQSISADMDALKKRPVVKKTHKKVKEKNTGKLAAKDINKIFRRHKKAMRKCYERQLKANPGLEGRVRLMVTIASTGSVSSAKASGLSGRVHNCMERQARTMKFPKPTGGSVVAQKPYSFSPEI